MAPDGPSNFDGLTDMTAEAAVQKEVLEGEEHV